MPDEAKPKYPPTRTRTDLYAKIKPLAREMRKAPTPAENELWQHIRKRQIQEARFRRQHPIDRFIVDFYCPEILMVIEVDGDIHEQQQDYDAIRQAYLESLGLFVLRFTNGEVMMQMQGVLERIGEVVLERRQSPPPNPTAK